jgi:hypothetical protein
MTNDPLPANGTSSHYSRHFDFLEKKVSKIIATHGSAAAARYYKRQYSLLQRIERHQLWIVGLLIMMFFVILRLSNGPSPLLSRETAIQIIGPALFIIPLMWFFLIPTFQRRCALFKALTRSMSWFDAAGSLKLPSQPFVLHLRSFAAEQSYYEATRTHPTVNSLPSIDFYSGFFIKRMIESLSDCILVVEALNLGEYGGSHIVEDIERISLYEFDNWRQYIAQIAAAADVIVLHYDDETSGLDFELSVASRWQPKTVVICPEHLLASFDCQLSKVTIQGSEQNKFANFITYKHEVLNGLNIDESGISIKIGRAARQSAVLNKWNSTNYLLGAIPIGSMTVRRECD